jgi:hypothetical protein
MFICGSTLFQATTLPSTAAVTASVLFSIHAPSHPACNVDRKGSGRAAAAAELGWI